MIHDSMHAAAVVATIQFHSIFMNESYTKSNRKSYRIQIQSSYMKKNLPMAPPASFQ